MSVVKKIVRNIVFRLLVLYVIVYVVIYALTAILVVVDTGMKLDATIYNRQALEFTDEADLNMLYSDFGEENVTRVNRWLDRMNEHVYFVDPSFLNTGITSINLSYETDIVEEIELIEGSIWEKGSMDHVMVIDEWAAEWLNLGVGDTYEIYTNSGESWEIIGIVSSVSYPPSDRGMLHLDLPKYTSQEPIIPRVYYVPYNLQQEITEDINDPVTVNTIIIKSDSIFDLKNDTDKVGTYLQDKYDKPYHNSNWQYNSTNVINNFSLVNNEVHTRGFLGLVLFLYGGTILLIFFRKKYLKQISIKK